MLRKFNPTTTDTVIVGVTKGKVSNGRQYWKYVLSWNSKLIFTGDDLSGPLGQSEKDALDNAICFLSCMPGYTDEDYFKDYTQDQLDWSNSYACECMQIYTEE